MLFLMFRRLFQQARRAPARLLLLVLGLAWWPAVVGQAAMPALVTIDRAWFETAGRAPEQVVLPDTWAHRGLAPSASGRYRLNFALSQVPEEPLALFFTHLSTDHRVYINGQLADGEGQGPAGANAAHPMPTLVALPPVLLRRGVNEVRLEVRYATTAGLSVAVVGSAGALRELHQRHLMHRIELPQALNMATAALALLLLLIWCRRRSEVALGSFGALALIGATRNYSYYLFAAFGPADVADWMMFCANVWTVALLGVFGQALAGVRWPRYSRWLLLLAVLLPAVAAWAIAEGHSLTLRRGVYPVLIATSLVALWLCLSRARAQRGWPLAVQAAGVLAVVAAGVHDYALQTAGWLPATEPFWMPYVMPVALGTVALALVQRMVGALGEVEALAVDLEARVQLRTRELHAASAAKTRFLASASHDLRQPLVAVGLMVGLARERADPVTRALLDKAETSVAAMETLMTGLLDLSQLEAGGTRVRLAPVPLMAVFQAIESHAGAAAADKGLRLRLRPTTAVALTDRVLFERALRNLVANAIRYTERGTVLVAVRRRGGQLVVQVRDSGIGIAEADQHRIFEEFVQLASAPPDGRRGLGLGLSIVNRSAELMGHTVGLRSQPGQGSCFSLTLPPAPGGSPPSSRARAMKFAASRSEPPRPAATAHAPVAAESSAAAESAALPR